MKVRPECVSCLFERAVFECDLVLEDEPEKKIEALKELLEYAAENFSVDTVPALIGTVREEIIKKYSGSNDPYEEFKHESNETAKRLLPMAREFYESAEDKLEALVRIIAAANSMEYGVRGHSYDHATFHRVFEETIKERLVWDKENIRSSMESHDKILYLLDNCGEVIFDIFAIKRLFEMGKEVVVAPKTGPIINDATVKDLKEAGYEHKIVPSGSYIGISLEECPEDFLKLFWDPDYLILAKGMGNFETISEFQDKLKGRLIYILRAKCQPVAFNLGARKGELVARLV